MTSSSHKIAPKDHRSICVIFLNRLIDLLKVVRLFHLTHVFNDYIHRTSFDCLPFAKTIGWLSLRSDCTKTYRWIEPLFFVSGVMLNHFYLTTNPELYRKLLHTRYTLHRFFSLPLYMLSKITIFTEYQTIGYLASHNSCSHFRGTSSLTSLTSQKKMQALFLSNFSWPSNLKVVGLNPP